MISGNFYWLRLIYTGGGGGGGGTSNGSDVQVIMFDRFCVLCLIGSAFCVCVC